MARHRTSDMQQHVLLLDPRNRVRPLLEPRGKRDAWTLEISSDTGSARKAIRSGNAPSVMLLTVNSGEESEALAAVRTLRVGPATHATRVVALLDDDLSLDEEGLLRDHDVDACWRLSALTPSLLAGIVTSELRSVSRVRAQSRPPVRACNRGSSRELSFERIVNELGVLVDENRNSLRWLSDIIAQLRDADRLRALDTRELDLHASVDAALATLHAELEASIRIVREYTDIPPVQCNAALMEQVFLQVIRNAVQALEGSGEIHITTTVRNGHAVVSIRDSGPGIADDALPEIFSPYFTTRPRGQHVGLGLPVSYGIVARHGGHVEVESRCGDYTEFRIHLPVVGVLDAARVTH